MSQRSVLFIKSWNWVEKYSSFNLHPKATNFYYKRFAFLADVMNRWTTYWFSNLIFTERSCMSQGLILSGPCASLPHRASLIPRLAFITVWCLSLKRHELPAVSVPGEVEQMWMTEKCRKGWKHRHASKGLIKYYLSSVFQWFLCHIMMKCKTIYIYI